MLWEPGGKIKKGKFEMSAKSFILPNELNKLAGLDGELEEKAWEETVKRSKGLLIVAYIDTNLEKTGRIACVLRKQYTSMLIGVSTVKTKDLLSNPGAHADYVGSINNYCITLNRLFEKIWDAKEFLTYLNGLKDMYYYIVR